MKIAYPLIVLLSSSLVAAGPVPVVRDGTLSFRRSDTFLDNLRSNAARIRDAGLATRTNGTVEPAPAPGHTIVAAGELPCVGYSIRNNG